MKNIISDYSGRSPPKIRPITYCKSFFGLNFGGREMKNTNYYIVVDGKEISVSKEVYYTYKRSLWAEKKRKEREKRCRNENGHICKKACKNCNQMWNANVLSLDKLIEEGFEIADDQSTEETVQGLLQTEELYEALAKLNPEELELVYALFFDESTESVYAKKIGVSQPHINKQKKRILNKLKLLLNK